MKYASQSSVKNLHSRVVRDDSSTVTSDTSVVSSHWEEDSSQEITSMHDNCFFFFSSSPQAKPLDKEQEQSEMSQETIRSLLHKELTGFFGPYRSVQTTEHGDCRFLFGKIVFQTSIDGDNKLFTITASGNTNAALTATEALRRRTIAAVFSHDETRFDLTERWNASVLCDPSQGGCVFKHLLVEFLMKALSLSRVN